MPQASMTDRQQKKFVKIAKESLKRVQFSAEDVEQALSDGERREALKRVLAVNFTAFVTGARLNSPTTFQAAGVL